MWSLTVVEATFREIHCNGATSLSCLLLLLLLPRSDDEQEHLTWDTKAEICKSRTNEKQTISSLHIESSSSTFTLNGASSPYTLATLDVNGDLGLCSQSHYSFICYCPFL
jgi:hypothetical protein